MANQGINWEDLQEERFRRDPAARERWERTAFARAVASAIIRYRVEHGLSQGKLAKQLGMVQPNIFRLELGEHNPTPETLHRLAKGLGLRFVLDVGPSEAAPAGLATESCTRTEVVTVDGVRITASIGTR